MARRYERSARWALLVFSVSGAAFLGWTTSGSDQSVTSHFDGNELASRLAQLAPATQEPVTDAEPYLNARGEDVTKEVSYLMSKYGISATQAVAQLEQQRKASVAAKWVYDEVSDRSNLGGLWVDHSRGGILVVATTDSALGRKITSAASDLLSIESKTANTTEAQLMDLADDVIDSLGLIDEGTRLGTGVPYYNISVQPQHERLVLGQSSLAPDNLVTLAKKFEANPLIVLEDLGPVLFTRGGDTCPQTNCSSESGSISAVADGGWCSIGFTATYRVSGIDFPDYLLSAGHCGADNGDRIRHVGSSGPIMGKQIWEKDSGAVDASVIDNVDNEMTQNSGYIRRGANNFWSIKGVEDRNEIELGIILCRTGYVSEDCGELISKGAVENGNYGLGQLEDVSACGGDSGGPVHNTSNYYAVGLHQSSSDSSSCSPTEDSYFSFITKLQDANSSVVIDTVD